MDAILFADLQEALIGFFVPVIIGAMFLLVAGGVLSAIGVVVLELANRLTG